VIDGLYSAGKHLPVPKASARPMRCRAELRRHGRQPRDPGDDGDFNVGITSRDELKGFVERERGKGIFLSILAFAWATTTTP